MTVLVTTPLGAVGRYVTEALRDRSDVRFLVRSAASAEALDGSVRGEVFRGDAANAADVRRAVVGVDRLFLAHPFAEDQIAAETALGVPPSKPVPGGSSNSVPGGSAVTSFPTRSPATTTSSPTACAPPASRS
ncbi:NAD(P)H-binding protein [Streptomyces sp. NPDC057579]|uniref:NAD(P)H-binding protein n=1 Tax=Streptomyces sp. NPDC057579 TaxID=3346172 RepID=UPI0036883A2D